MTQPYLNHNTDPNTTQTPGERYGDDRKSTPSTHFIKIKLYRNKQEQAAAELGQAQRIFLDDLYKLKVGLNLGKFV